MTNLPFRSRKRPDWQSLTTDVHAPLTWTHSLSGSDAEDALLQGEVEQDLVGWLFRFPAQAT